MFGCPTLKMTYGFYADRRTHSPRARQLWHETLEYRRVLTNDYADPFPGSDNNPGTLERPYATMRQLSSSLADGDPGNRSLQVGDTANGPTSMEGLQVNQSPEGEFSDDLENLDTTCWDDHLTANGGFSFLGSESCDWAREIGQGDNIRLVESDRSHSGTHALEITFSENEDLGQSVYHLAQPSDYLQTTQLVRFSNQYDFAFGQKIHRIFSAGTDGFLNFDMVVNVWGRPVDGVGDMTGINDSQAVSLNYGGSRDGLDWGSAMNESFSLQRDRWYKITSEVQLNTVGMSNGWVRLFIDDALVAEKANLEIRASSDHQMNRVMFGSWYSNDAAGNNPQASKAPASPTSLLIDDVSISTNREAAPTLATPTILSPNGVVVIPRPQFRWSAVAGAKSYELRVVDASGTAIINASVDSSDLTPVTDILNGDYRFEVRARAGDEASGWASQNFQVRLPEVMEFENDFEGPDDPCWRWHLESPSGYSHLVAGESCDGFHTIGNGPIIQRIKSPDAHSGEFALQVNYDKDEDRGQVITTISSGSEYVRTNQWMQFGDTFDFGRGQKIHRLFGIDNDDPELADFDIAVIVWGKAKDGLDSTDMTGVNDSYLISVNYNGGFNDWGAAWGDFSFNRGQWYEITTEVQLNSAGHSNGAVRLWINGVLVAHKTNLLIRANSDVLIDNILFGGWYSNLGLDAASPTILLIDDVSYSTKPLQGTSQEILVSGTEAGVRVEEGQFLDTVMIALSSAPTQNVTVEVTVSSTQDLDATPNLLTFTPTNWHVPQSIGLSAIDDTLVEGDENGRLTITVTDSSDPGWLDVADVLVATTIQDNDSVDVWHNTARPLDVTDDGFVTPLDALIIINLINLFGGQSIHVLNREQANGYVDTNNDQFVGPVDVLIVVNEINLRSQRIQDGGAERLDDGPHDLAGNVDRVFTTWELDDYGALEPMVADLASVFDSVNSERKQPRR